ncbi:MAG: nuclear transport factor 2 family protein [Mucilaginibacter polytrichastri]|nr:nuclear transport factor 2 family protein [Mucilaginibacter polytrichastri]
MKGLYIVLPVIVLLHAPALAQQNARDMNKELIETTIRTLFHAVDARKWDEVKHCFADTVLVDFTSMNGGSPQRLTAEQIVKNWSVFLPGFDRTKHRVFDFHIKIEGEKGSAHYSGVAEHFLDNAIWTVTAGYDAELIFRDGRWQIRLHKLNLESQSGNTGLPQKAAERISRQ